MLNHLPVVSDRNFPLGYMDNAYQGYGDIFNAPLIGNYQRLLLVSNPEGLQQLFTRDSKEFYTPSNGLLQLIVGDNSIFCLESDRSKDEKVGFISHHPG
ncbi:hypothetical protein [Nostoc sp.]|uniref:hypothetical protein n=1 Tax=Nostoc sp. TaxID=1180 RepID=UPI002FFD461C